MLIFTFIIIVSISAHNDMVIILDFCTILLECITL